MVSEIPNPAQPVRDPYRLTCSQMEIHYWVSITQGSFVTNSTASTFLPKSAWGLDLVRDRPIQAVCKLRPDTRR